METPVESTVRQIVYRLSRFETIDGWWAWTLLLAAFLVLLVFIVRLYRRDTVELSGPLRTALVVLRLAAVAGLVVFFLSPERRTQQRITRPSELVVLVDTSQSMSLPAGDAAGSRRRIDEVQRLLGESEAVAPLVRDHRVTVYGFDAGAEPREMAVFAPEGDVTPDRSESERHAPPTADASVAWIGVVLLALGFAAMLWAGWLGWRGAAAGADRLALTATLAMLVGGTVLGVAYTTAVDRSMGELLGFGGPASRTRAPAEDDEPPERTPALEDDWVQRLEATGTESRIGDALRAALVRHDASTLAGVVLLSDGESNAGTSVESAAQAAARSAVAVYPIGFGSARPPENLRVVEIEAPPRVYPEDRFEITATLQASGLAGRTAQVELLDGADGEEPPSEVVGSQRVEIEEDGRLISVRFELEPESVGRRRLAVRAEPVEGEQNIEDNARRARYEVVERRLRVLVLAGGPTREYRFVRNLLHRDRDITLDVLLQSGQQGMSQEANELLRSFPADPSEMFDYDAVLAFDPDWMALEEADLELLERWVGEQAGGLAVVAGPIYMPALARLRDDRRAEVVRGLLPVEMASRSLTLDSGRFEGDTPWPPEITAEGRRASFLQIGDDPEETADVWQQFSGVYGYFASRGPKPGAAVYARFSDPTTATDDELPVYMASQFYGAGRVFMMGSGEMWRLRADGDAYFDRFYTKLLRWVSEGRLLRDSSRGILLVDRPRAMVGDTVTVRAILTDAQYQPLDLPQVEAQLLEPEGEARTVVLRQMEGQPREGTYGGQFVARRGGEYELRLELGDVLERQVLSQSVQVRLPTLELERPQRNDRVLDQLASVTGGESLTAPDDSAGSPLAALAERIVPQPQVSVLPGTPDRDFQRRRNASLMLLISLSLGLEWMLRRLNRLA